MEEVARHEPSWASGNTKSKERRERYHSYKTGPKVKGRFISCSFHNDLMFSVSFSII